MDGALREMSSMVVRVRELAIQAASDTYSNLERSMMDRESKQLINEIKRSASSSMYMDHHLLRGDNKKLDIQVDANNGKANRISIDLSDFSQDPIALGIGDVSLDSKLHAQLALVKLDYAQGEISKSRAKAGAFMTRLASTSSKLDIDTQTGKSAHSKIKDADYAHETAKNVKDKIVASAQTMVQSQINNSSSNALKLIG